MGATEPGTPAPRPSPDLERPRRLLEAFHTALSMGTTPVTVLYSGGLDSSMVAFCMKHLGVPVQLLAVGTADAPDLASAAEGAKMLGLPFSPRVLRPEEIHRSAVELAGSIGAVHEPDRSVRLALALALEAAPDPRVVCGQGADELFGGYAHFRGLSDTLAEERRLGDLRHLLESEWPWAVAFAERSGRTLVSPFLAEDVRSEALGLRASEWLTPDLPKAWLRQLATAHGLPAGLAGRAKRAMQYGSRVRRELRRLLPPPGPETGPGP